MASVWEIPRVVRQMGLIKSFTSLWTKACGDNIFLWASALSYSWLLALFPFVISLLALLPYIPERQKQQVMDGMQNLVHQTPGPTRDMLAGFMDQAAIMLHESHRGLLSLGLIVALWTASAGMSQTMSAMEKCYDVSKPERPFYTQRAIAIALTIVSTTLMLLVLLLLPVGGLVINWVWRHSHLPDSMFILANIARWALAVFLMMAALNVIYYFGTRVRQRYRFVTPGAGFCVLVWVLMGLGFRYYVDRFAIQGYNKTYGAVGGVAILLVLMYLCAVAMLVGAEINGLIDREVQKSAPAESDLEEPAEPPPESP
jgi:membrane protein